MIPAFGITAAQRRKPAYDSGTESDSTIFSDEQRRMDESVGAVNQRINSLERRLAEMERELHKDEDVTLLMTITCSKPLNVYEQRSTKSRKIGKCRDSVRVLHPFYEDDGTVWARAVLVDENYGSVTMGYVRVAKHGKSLVSSFAC